MIPSGTKTVLRAIALAALVPFSTPAAHAQDRGLRPDHRVATDPSTEATANLKAFLANRPSAEAAYYAVLLKGPPCESLDAAKAILDRAATGDAEAAYFVRIYHIESGDKPAAEYLLDAAKKGFRPAVLEAALSLYEKNPDRALELLAKPLSEGNPEACLIAGVIRSDRAVSDADLRGAIALLKTAYGPRKKTNNAHSAAQEAAGKRLSDALLRLAEPGPDDFEELAALSDRYLDATERAWVAGHRDNADPRQMLGALRDRLRLAERRHGDQGPRIDPGVRLRKLYDRLPPGEKIMAVRAVAEGYGNPTLSIEDRKLYVGEALVAAEHGESWARSFITSESYGAGIAGDAALKERIAAASRIPTSARSRLYGHVHAKMNTWYPSGRTPTPFATIDPVLAPFDAPDGVDHPARAPGESEDAFAFRSAVLVLSASPGDAAALQTIREQADAKLPFACLYLAADTADFPTKIALLKIAATAGTAGANDRLSRAASSPKNPAPDYVLAITAAKIATAKSPSDNGIPPVQLVRSHREVYASEEDYRKDLASVMKVANEIFMAQQKERAAARNAPSPAEAKRVAVEKPVAGRMWLETRAAAGDADALVVLGHKLREGSGTRRTGTDCLKRAVALGDAEAAFELGQSNDVTAADRLRYLATAAKGGISAAYRIEAALAGTGDTSDPAERKRLQEARLAVLREGAAAGDFECAMAVAEEVSDGREVRDRAGRLAATLDAEKLFLAIKPGNEKEAEARRHALLRMYAEDHFSDPATMLAKITTLAPELVKSPHPPAREKSKRPFEYAGDGGLTQGYARAPVTALLYAVEAGSADAAYLLAARTYADGNLTGRPAEEWMVLAKSRGQRSAVDESLISSLGKARARDLLPAEKNRIIEEALKATSGQSVVRSRVALAMAEAMFAAGRGSEFGVWLRKAAISGEGSAISLWIQVNCMPAERRRELPKDFVPDLNEACAWLLAGSSEGTQIPGQLLKDPRYDEKIVRKKAEALRKELAR